jgi:hypothetical protein
MNWGKNNLSPYIMIFFTLKYEKFLSPLSIPNHQFLEATRELKVDVLGCIVFWNATMKKEKCGINRKIGFDIQRHTVFRYIMPASACFSHFPMLLSGCLPEWGQPQDKGTHKNLAHEKFTILFSFFFPLGIVKTSSYTSMSLLANICYHRKRSE